MASGSIRVKLRPLRLAFVIEPNDRGAVLKAIQTASSLWGGSYCPIVPYYRHLPRGWGWHGRGAGSNAQEDAIVFEGRPRTEVHLIAGTGHCAFSKLPEVMSLVFRWLPQHIAGAS
jgi:hypothetical protein